MTRLATLTREKMAPPQREAYDRIVESRSRVPQDGVHDVVYEPMRPNADGSLAGPFNAWVRSPHVGSALVALGGALRFRTTLAPRLTELAILVVAREWTAQYEWYAHARFAAKAGIEPEILETIRRKERPRFSRPDDQAVYTFAVELLRTRGVSDATYQALLGQVGEQGVVELVGLLGFYTTVSMTLNTFRVQPPGERPPLDP
ncbi:MAG: 4-carboxymuconolactone decarboxylase [Candidatus Rokuibacteriota bacterium]|nr:MAG: 4-carboxymuconolactone decarboxylase [Candidatus Rokubacteria bacterium]